MTSPVSGLQAAASPATIAAVGAPVRRAAWRLEIAGRDVTRDLIEYVTTIAYVDHTHGEADDVEVVLENRDGRWLDAWFPAKGDALRLWIGYEGSALVPCGRFQIDEVAIAGLPDTVTLKAIAAGVSPALRTRRSEAHEGLTLRELAERVAARHGLTVVGLTGHVHIGRTTQHQETDLTFLRRTAEAWGYVFTVKGTQLVFHDQRRMDAGEGGGAVVALSHAALTSYELRHGMRGVVQAAEVRYHDPTGKKTIASRVPAASGRDEPGPGIAGDTAVVHARVESPAQAETRARAALHRRNRREIEGMLKTEGDPRLIAGNRVTLGDEFGAFAGTYTIDSAAHRLERGAGYTTEVEVVSGGVLARRRREAAGTGSAS